MLPEPCEVRLALLVVGLFAASILSYLLGTESKGKPLILALVLRHCRAK